jgi:multidrug efflux pump subunit AcrB
MLVAIMAGSVLLLLAGSIKVEMFATDYARLFYVSVEMPAGTTVEKTLHTTLTVEQALKSKLQPEELRAIASYAGIHFTNQEFVLGDHNGQVVVSLKPKLADGRTVDEIIASARDAVTHIPGPVTIYFLRVITGAPPTFKPVSIKVRGDNQQEIRRAADEVIGMLQAIPAARDITDDDIEGDMELAVRLKPDAITRAGLNPLTVTRDVRLLTDGEVVASMQERGEPLDVRVRAHPETLRDIDNFLQYTVGLADGNSVPLQQLLYYDVMRGKGNIRHYNFRRTITVEAELDKQLLDTVAVNNLIQQQWSERFATRFPDVSLEFAGELDNINESLDALGILFLFGVGLIYIILSAQFRSYVQPFIILVTVPIAFCGVLFGLWFSGNPLSLYSLYGTVALAGMAVNGAIVLMAAANEHLERGMSVAHAIVYASRRRIIPILMTSVTTIAGLLSLAAGWGGKSLMWGPVATCIVWGLGTSTILTMFLIPLLYNAGVRQRVIEALPLPMAITVYETSESPFKRVVALLRAGTLTGISRSEQYKAVDIIARHPQLQVLYMEGRRLMFQKDYMQACRIFERALAEAPDNGILHVCAAHSLILLMQEEVGPEPGYLEWAKQHLHHARNLVPGDKRLPLLQKAYNNLVADRAD